MADPFMAIALIAVLGLMAMFLWRIGDYLWRVSERLESIASALERKADEK